MWAGFAALGRSRLNCRKHNWTAPVELTAVQPSPWLYRESTAPQENTQETKHRERRAHPNTAKEEATRQIQHKQTNKQTNSTGDQLNQKKGGDGEQKLSHLG